MARVTFKTFLKMTKARRAGKKRWLAFCPAHLDIQPALSIREGGGGIVLIHCLAGCSFEQIEKSVGRTLNSRFHPGCSTNKQRRHADLGGLVRKYSKLIGSSDYLADDGALLYQVLHYAGGYRIRRPNGYGGWIEDPEGTQDVLYNLPRVTRSRIVLIARWEGEADDLAALFENRKLRGQRKIAVTANAGGFRGWTLGCSRGLKGKHVILFYGDDRSRKRIELVARSVHRNATSVRLVYLPGLEPCTPLAGWIDEHNLKAFWSRVKSSKRWHPAAEQSRKVR